MSADEDMSLVSDVDNTVLMHHLYWIFAPILRDNNNDPIPPYNTIVPLTEADFPSDPSLRLTHIAELAALHDTITLGFREGAPLNQELWLHLVIQLLTSALKGFSASCPDNDTLEQLNNLCEVSKGSPFVGA